MRAFVLTLLVVVPVMASAQSLGSIDFPTSATNAEAKAAFERGLLLLHSFEYVDARDAFQEARQLEPFDFPMAAWGEAMTHNRPIWQQQDRDEGRRALASLGDFPNGYDDLEITERERHYLRTAHGLFFGEGEKNDRDDAFELAMAELAAAYPDDLDAQSLWALSILGTAHEGRDFATYMRAAAILEEVFAANLEHPGAAHYLIHAYDDVVHAPLGLRPARVYDKVAPDASHALHMPSHIYLALGMWDDTADMNQRSFEAATANSERRGEPLNNHGWHALYWWTYAEAQRNNTSEIRRLVALAQDLVAEDPSVLARTHLIRIRAHALAANVVDDPQLDIGVEGTSPSTRATELFIRSILNRGSEASEELAAMAAEEDASGTVQAYAIMVAAMAGDPQSCTAEQELRDAVELVDSLPLAFGPPTPVIPPELLLAQCLASQDRNEEAATALQGALTRIPGHRMTTDMLQSLNVDAATAGTR